MVGRYYLLALVGVVLLPGVAPGKPRLLSGEDIARFSSPPPDARISYGSDPLQFGELRLPAGRGAPGSYR